MSYKIYYDRIPNISHLKVFDSWCFILKTKNQLQKFDAKSQNGLFLDYALNESCYRLYNLETNVVEEFTNIIFYKLSRTKG